MQTRVGKDLAPLGVWDTRDDAFWDGNDALLRAIGAIAWGQAHIPDCDDVYRVEFYLVDAPFAVVYRFARNSDGLKYIRNGQAVTEPAALVPLDELPPQHLLRLP